MTRRLVPLLCLLPLAFPTAAAARTSAPAKTGGGSTAAKSLPAPTGVTAVAVSSNLIYISWTPPATTSTIIGYQLYRNGQALNANYFSADNPTRYGDWSYLTPSTTYSYQVAAVNSTYQVGTKSATVSARTLPKPTTTDPDSPTAPTALTAVKTGTAGGLVKIRVSWSPSSDPDGVLGYAVYQPAMIAVTDQTSFTALEPPGCSWTFSTRALEASGNISAGSVGLPFTS
jgi:hypothetical protein